MTGWCLGWAAVRSEAGVAVAAAVVAAAAVVGCGPGSPAPAATDPPAAEASAGSAVDAGSAPASRPEDPAAAAGEAELVLAPSEDPAGAAADPAVETSAAASADPGSELAVQIAEPPPPAPAPAAGALQEVPAEPGVPEEPLLPDDLGTTGGTGTLASDEGGVFTWRDGDETVEARLQLDMAVVAATTAASDAVVAVLGDGSVVAHSKGSGAPVASAVADNVTGTASGLSRTVGGQPVFRSESGELMTLPGGVLVVLDEGWDAATVAAFWAGNGISPARVSPLDFAVNGFLVETGPGFASLDLANTLAAQHGVEISSPNWWTERAVR